MYLLSTHTKSVVNKFQRPFYQEVAREFRFSMARSSRRNFGAESAMDLPPLPPGCLPVSNECRLAAIAHAPCLPAAAKMTKSIVERQQKVPPAAPGNSRRRPNCRAVSC